MRLRTVQRRDDAVTNAGRLPTPTLVRRMRNTLEVGNRVDKEQMRCGTASDMYVLDACVVQPARQRGLPAITEEVVAQAPRTRSQTQRCVRDPGSAGVNHLDADVLFRAHSGFVARFLSRLGADSQDVPDLLQEVFLVAHRRGGFVPERAKPTTWLGAIAVRVLADRRKKLRRVLEDCDTAKVAVVPSRLAGPDDDTDSRRELARVQDVLDRLTPEKRDVFVRFELQGESCKTIADRLHVPVGTVYSRLHSARKDFARVSAEASRASQSQPVRSPPPAPVGPPPPPVRRTPSRAQTASNGSEGYGADVDPRLVW